MVAAIVRADDADHRAELSSGFFNAARPCGAHEVLELGEELLDWVQVWAIGQWQDQMSPRDPDGGTSSVTLAAAEVFENDDVTRRQARYDHLFGMGCE